MNNTPYLPSNVDIHTTVPVDGLHSLHPHETCSIIATDKLIADTD